jgi:subtilase family serine protease
VHAKRLGLLLLLSAGFVFGQQPASRFRIVDPVENAVRIPLRGNTHFLARAEFDRGAAQDSMPAQRMLLLLSGAPEQQAALQQLLDEQQTPGSANYRHWLTPAEFGQAYGASDADVHTITNWLQQQGFQVNRVASGKNVIEFSGSAGQVRQTFRTALHKYVVAGKEYWANASDPQIPAALAPVVKGIVSLNNFPRKPLSHHFGLFSRDPHTGKVSPQFTVVNGTTDYYAIGPADFATIYNTAALLQLGFNGAGQVIAIVGRSNVQLQDIANFRAMFALGGGNTSVVIDGPDPGLVNGDETESVLDLEWANAVAPGASVVLVSAESTETTSGLDLAALHIIENNMAGVMSESYGGCEASFGNAGNQFLQAMWQQAAAQGITVIVSSGDSGSAGCDDPNTSNLAQYGRAVNAIASTPYNVAVGGTDFDDSADCASYWKSTNNQTTLGSAWSYIPEMAWNGTCAATATATNLNVCPTAPASGNPPASLNLWAAAGGASNCSVSTTSAGATVCQSGTPKPSWQSGRGVPSDGVRDLPDVSLYSAVNTSSRSFYVVCEADLLPSGYSSCQLSGNAVYFSAYGGTSVAAPSFAAITALAAQKAGTRLGNINYLLYSLAATSGASCAASGSQTGCTFHDVTKGNNSVPCVAGSPNCSQTSGTATGVLIDSNRAPAYSAAAGYDLATGLGSVDAARLAAAIAAAIAKYTPSTTTLTLNGGTSTITAKHGDAITVAVDVTPTSSTGPVSLLGSKGGIDSETLRSGTASWTSKLFPGGSYSVEAHYAGDGARAASDSNSVPVSISPENSQTFVNLVTFDDKGNLQSFTGNSAPYGSNYVLRMDVTDAAGTVSAAQGVSSKCAGGAASCPTGALTVTSNGGALDGGSFPLNSAGHAEDQYIQLLPGTYTIAATYPGDASYNPSNGSTLVNIGKAPTTVSSSAGVPPVTYGTVQPLTANVATTSNGAAPGGSFSFFDNGTQIYVSSTFFQGYPGNASKPTHAWLTESANYAFTSVGAHSVTAQYSGDANYAGGTSAPDTFTVVQAPTHTTIISATPTPTTPALPITLTAQTFEEVSSSAAAPTGQVTFSDNGTPMSGTVTYSSHPGSLTATLSSHASAPAGTHSITASYSGDTNYTSSSAPELSLTVYSLLPVALSSVSATISPALVNYPTALTVAVGMSGINMYPTPTGTITFYDNGTALPGPVAYNSFSAFSATLTYSFSTAGTHNITASYSGDAIFAACSTTTPLALSVVNKRPTNISSFYATPAVANQPTNLRATVLANGLYDIFVNGPAMSGTVTFLDGGTAIPGTATIASAAGSITASLTYTFTTPGVHNITVQYSGDNNYAATSQVFPTTIAGPLALSLDFNSVTLSSMGGTGIDYLSVTNNTSSAATVALTCTPSSAAATCSLSSSQATLSPSAANTVTFTYTVPALAGNVYHRRTPWTGASGIVLAGVLAGAWMAGRKRRSLILAVLGAALLLSMFSCGGGGSSSGGSAPPPTPQTYTFTITGTSGANTATQLFTVTVGGS